MRPGDGRATNAVFRNLCRDAGGRDHQEIWQTILSPDTSFEEFVERAQSWLLDKSELRAESVRMANWRKIYNMFKQQLEPEPSEEEKAIRAKIAQELLKAMDNSSKVVQPGLWYAATLVDPSVNSFNND